jgi:hypothetical protein
MASADDALNEDYRCYRGGGLALTANERHQLGFRLAAMIGHERVHAIDWHDEDHEIGWDTAIDFAREHGQHQLISFVTDLEQQSDEGRIAERERLRSMSVREHLLEMNDPAIGADGHRIYMDLARVGAGPDYVGADVILRWYERNMKIFVNIARLATSPDDRILVVIGSGHLPLLTHFAAGSGRFELVTPDQYLN